MQTVSHCFFSLRNPFFFVTLSDIKQTREDGEIPSRARRCDQGRKLQIYHCLKRWEGVASRVIWKSEDLSGVNSGQSPVGRGVSMKAQDKNGIPEHMHTYVRGFLH
jgi:hypothetical protein